MKWGSNKLEGALAAIWKELLGVAAVGPNDNFFDLGGDSVMALRLISMVSERLGIDLSFKVLYRSPTLSKLSGAIGELPGSAGDGSMSADAPDAAKDPHILELDGERYFKVSTAQLYWVNDAIDRAYKSCDKHHGTVRIHYHLLGKLDIDALKQAFAYLIGRHESLRSTFHKRGDQYYMKVEKEDSPAYLPEYTDWSDGFAEDTLRADPLREHRFDVQKGPLFLVRINKNAEESCLLVILMHHSIYDGLSSGVIQRDLLIAYEAFSKGCPPELPPLKYQFRDYLLFANRYIDKHAADHRRYWAEMYPDLPPELIIPGARRQAFSMARRIRRVEEFSMPGDVVVRLDRLAKHFSERMFILLQTTFRTYLHAITGIGDILLGTYVYGRDHPDSENQIGGYARTMLVRTSLDPGAPFYDCLQKVRKSNDEMYFYTAHTLMDRMQELLRPGEKMYERFWKINLQYHNPDQEQTDEPDAAEILERLHLGLAAPPPGPHREFIIPIDMQVSFFNRGEEIDVSVRYDSSSYDAAKIRDLMNGYFDHIQQAVPEVMGQDLTPAALPR